jgi:hypothetical protein
VSDSPDAAQDKKVIDPEELQGQVVERDEQITKLKARIAALERIEKFSPQQTIRKLPVFGNKSHEFA